MVNMIRGLLSCFLSMVCVVCLFGWVCACVGVCVCVCICACVCEWCDIVHVNVCVFFLGFFKRWSITGHP